VSFEKTAAISAPVPRGSSLALLAALGLGLGLALGCDEEPQAPKAATPPAPTDVVLRLGDFEITDAELNRYVPFLRQQDAQVAGSFARRVLLSDYVLPFRMARKLADPAKMAEAKSRAEELAEAVEAAGGDVGALMRLGQPFGGFAMDDFVTPLPRFPVDFAQAAWDVPPGRSSAAIETVWGYALVGVLEERSRPAPLTGTKRRLYTVFFPFSTDQSFRPEVERSSQSLLEEIRYVHPHYRDEFAALSKSR
jgi:hypothetical protein